MRTTLEAIVESDRIAAWAEQRSQQASVAIILGGGLGAGGWLAAIAAGDWAGFVILLLGGAAFLLLGRWLADWSIRLMSESLAVLLEEQLEPTDDELGLMMRYLERMRYADRRR